MKNVLTSWKSTIAGIAAGLIGVINGAAKGETIMQMVQDPLVQIAFVLMILGLVAKDGNVTGGTVGQPSTPKALMVANQAPSTANPPVSEKTK